MKKLSITPGSENSASFGFNRQRRFAEFLLPGTPKKSLGQNFLINPRILDKIISAAEISKNDLILEVGPGTGNLTEKLAEKAGRVIAIEKDRRLIELLREKFKNTNVEIVESDVLKLGIETLIGNLKLGFENSHYKVVGNIPYYITSHFLRKIFTEWPKPNLIVLTIQKEVAQRILAKPPKMNLLAISTQFFAKPEIISYVSKKNFRPVPKVDSAIIKLTPREKLQTDDVEKFFKIAKAGFAQKRKFLISNLSKIIKDKAKLLEAFETLKINPKTRAENLSLEDWINLANQLKFN